MNTYAIIIITGLLLFCAFLGGLALGVKLMAAESRDAIRFWRREHQRQVRRAADAEQLLHLRRYEEHVNDLMTPQSKAALRIVEGGDNGA